MTQNESNIIKNAVLDATEAYVEAKLSMSDFVKTQIGIVESYVERNKKYYHVVKCDNGRVTYNNVLSVGNIPFPANSTVFLIAPNAQFSNQFILGKLDDTPCSIRGGSININDKFIVNSDGTMTAKAGTFEGTISGGSININNGAFQVESNGRMIATAGTIGDLELGDGELYAYGIVNLLNNRNVSSSTTSSRKVKLLSFKPSTIGAYSNFNLKFDYTVTSYQGKTMTLQLLRRTGSSWNIQESYDLNTDLGEYTFTTTFNYLSNIAYQIVLIFGSSSTSTTQSVTCSLNTNRIIKTAMTTNGFIGNVNSANATIGNITLKSNSISSLDEWGENGFSISESALELNDDSYNYVRIYNDGWVYWCHNGSLTTVIPWSSSDKRNKEDILKLDPKMSIKLIDNTEVYKFKYKNSDGHHYGVMAQEVREVLDDLGETDSQLEYSNSNMDTLNVSYQEYIPLLINYVKDLRKIVIKQDKLIKKQQTQINEIVGKEKEDK